MFYYMYAKFLYTDVPLITSVMEKNFMRTRFVKIIMGEKFEVFCGVCVSVKRIVLINPRVHHNLENIQVFQCWNDKLDITTLVYTSLQTWLHARVLNITTLVYTSLQTWLYASLRYYQISVYQSSNMVVCKS